MKIRNEIGSEFSIFEYNSFDQNCDFYRSGRDALYAIAKRENKNKVLLPAYSCSSMIEPFIKSGYTIELYEINRDFKVDEEVILLQVAQNDILLIINYFGRKTFDRCLLNKIRKIKPEIIIIDDKTQNIFETPFLNENVNYAIASLRKWFSIPDGAVIANAGDVSFDKMANEDFFKAKSKAMCLKQDWLNCKSDDKQKMLDSFNIANKLLDNIGEYSISKTSLDNIRNIDITLYKNIRLANIAILSSTITDQDVYKVLDGDIALYYPVLINNRDFVKEKLSENGIYCPIIWEIENSTKTKFSGVEYISDHILAIPCDHRYNIADMNRIALVFNEIVKSCI